MRGGALLAPSEPINPEQFLEFEKGIYFRLFPDRDKCFGLWNGRLPMLDAVRSQRELRVLRAGNIRITEMDAESVIQSLMASVEPIGDTGPKHEPVRVIACSKNKKYISRPNIRETLEGIRDGISYAFDMQFDVYTGNSRIVPEPAFATVEASLLYNLPCRRSKESESVTVGPHINRYILGETEVIRHPYPNS